jgi:SP family sugar:H+ symporter-like MFS transporter
LAFQQFLGIPLFFGYATYFFASLIQGLILLGFMFLSFFVIDKFGRRPLLLWGGVVMAICTLATGAIGFMDVLPGAALVALTCIWTASYAISAGPLGEIISQVSKLNGG